MTDDTDRPSTPSLREFVERKIAAALAGLRVALPARVTKYDEQRQSLEVQVLVHHGYQDERGDRRVAKPPVVTDVPIQWPGSGTNRTTFPIAVGDAVLLICASSSIARLKLTGREGDPGDDRHHRLSDAIAIPGMTFLVDHPTTAPTDATVVHAAALKLGGPAATQAITRVNDVQTALMGALSDPTIAGAILAVSTPGGAVALEAAVTAYFATHPVTGSAKVKAE